jgi:hypothetical protein
MNEVEEIFERTFNAEIMPLLRDGLSNSFCTGLRFTLHPTLFASVKTAAFQSEVSFRVIS